MSDATTHRLKVSREGVVLIKSFEGFRPRAVRDEDGGWVIGYGHKASAREGLTVGEQDAELLLQYDLLPVVKALNERVSAPLNQHQFDALASFAISVGIDRFLASDVLQQLNDGHAGEAADALIGWPEATPPDARLRRRAAERALFVADPATPMHLADLLAAPLPPPPVEAPVEPEPPVVRPDFGASADARAAAVASLLGEAPSTLLSAVAPEPVDSLPPDPAFEPTASGAAPAVAPVHLQRYSPYGATIIGPLPGFPSATERPSTAVEPTPASREDARLAPVDGASATDAATVGTAPEEPVVPLVPPAPGVSPFPPMDAPLVLTPATEADFIESPRPAWEPDQRAGPVPRDEETVLFEEEPTLSVMHHEVEAVVPRRFDWSETGMYLVMGSLGLAAFAFSAAAFRKAMLDTSPFHDFTVIGWVLALIGVTCVGVSSFNLYLRWSRRD